MWIIDEQRPQTTAKSLARMLYPDPDGSAAARTVRRRRDQGLASFLRRVATRIMAMRERRVTIKRLAELSDRELADIGLSRGRLHEVFEPEFAQAKSGQHRSDTELGMQPVAAASRA